MALYSKCNMFERLLCLYINPCLPEKCMEKIIDVVFRATYVDGSTTLITRYALPAFINSVKGRREGRFDRKLTLLAARIIDTCDQEYVTTWENGTAKDTQSKNAGSEDEDVGH